MPKRRTISLTPANDETLKKLEATTGRTATDIINRALRLYGLVASKTDLDSVRDTTI